MKRSLPLLACLAALAGCVTPPPFPTPPPLPADVLPLPPVSAGPQAWQPGDWAYTAGSYRYDAGHYIPAGQAGPLWVFGHWAPDPVAPVWVPGHWS